MRKISLRILFMFIALFLVFILKSNVKAMTFTYNDTEYTVPDLPEDSEYFDHNYYSIFISPKDGKVCLLSHVGFVPSTMRVCVDNDSNQFGIMTLDGNVCDARVKFWNMSSDGSCWTFNSWQPDSSYYGYYSDAEDSTSFIYSTVNIYSATLLYSQSTGHTITNDIAFPQTALLLPPIVEKQRQAGEMDKVLQEIILILPTTLVVLVSYLGLRKALTMLWQLLHQA